MLFPSFSLPDLDMQFGDFNAFCSLHVHVLISLFYCKCHTQFVWFDFQVAGSLPFSMPDGQPSTAAAGYSCQICGKVLGTKKGLTCHTNLHYGKYQYTCNVCGKGFMSITRYHGHLSKHTGLRPFSCHHCGKTFDYKDTLTLHLKLNTCSARLADGTLLPKSDVVWQNVHSNCTYQVDFLSSWHGWTVEMLAKGKKKNVVCIVCRYVLTCFKPICVGMVLCV